MGYLIYAKEHSRTQVYTFTMTTETKNTQVAPAAAVAPAATTVAPPTARIFINLMLKKGMPAPVMRKIANMVAPERHSEERLRMMHELKTEIYPIQTYNTQYLSYGVQEYFRGLHDRWQREERAWEEACEVAARIMEQEQKELERMYQGGDMTNEIAVA
jgi:hypothetical protein